MKPNDTTSSFAVGDVSQSVCPANAFGDAQASLEPEQATVGNPMAECAIAGTRLGDFILLREIARGGMGVVYEANQVSLQRRVAVKVLPFSILPSSSGVAEKAIARFKNEAQAAAQIDHPHIVPVFAVGQENGVHYFAMQLIGGQSLASLLVDRRLGRKPASGLHAAFPEGHSASEHVREIARMGVQAAEALHAAHEVGVVHRDVKPSNLLLDEKGKVWVTDFGVARYQHSGDLTETGHVVGSMPYMSPEQALGMTALVDHRTDIYSLGITLYELAALRHPCEGASTVFTAALTAQATFRAAWRKPRHWNRAIPREFENIVLKAMAEERDERYATARELADDLRRFLAGEPIVARRPSIGARLEKWTRRNRRPAAAALAALSLALVGLATALVVISGERAQKDAAWRAAATNEARAEHNYRQAREVLDRFSARVNQLLANELPGAERVRKDLLVEMLPYYRQFAAEAAGDPALAADLATTYAKIGELCDQLGSLDEAESAYRNAQDIWRRLANGDSQQSEHRRCLALCDNQLGRLLRKRGELALARKEFERALQAQRELASTAPIDAPVLGELAVSESNLGLLLVEAGDSEGAAEHFCEAVAVRRSIEGKLPFDEANLRELASCYNNLSSLYLKESPQIAGGWLERALKIQLKLVEAHRDKRGYQSDLALTYNNLGAVHGRLDRWSDAEMCFADAIEIGKRLTNAAPAVTSYRRDLAVSWNNLGMIQASAAMANRESASNAERAWRSAEASFGEALELQRDLVAENPQDVRLLSSLAGIHNNLGIVRRGQGRLVEAADEFEAAVLAQRKAFERQPRVRQFRESLTKHYDNQIAVLRSLDRGDEARASVEARRGLWLDVPLAPRAPSVQASLGAIEPVSHVSGEPRVKNSVD